MTDTESTSRSITDRAGVSWTVVEIHPQRTERRMAERRRRPVGALPMERRRAERRVATQYRMRLAPEYAHGWLLLVSSVGDRRRIAPIPPRWATFSDTALELLTRIDPRQRDD